jgi:hypothetical protein
MWNLIVAYAVIAVVLVAYIGMILLRTRKIQNALDREN